MSGPKETAAGQGEGCTPALRRSTRGACVSTRDPYAVSVVLMRGSQQNPLQRQATPSNKITYINQTDVFTLQIGLSF